MEFLPRKFDSNRFDSPFGGETCSTVPRISFVVGSRLGLIRAERLVVAKRAASRGKRSERKRGFSRRTGMSAKGELMPMRAGAVNKRGLIKRLH